jgi:hypothetical protein
MIFSLRFSPKKAPNNNRFSRKNDAIIALWPIPSTAISDLNASIPYMALSKATYIHSTALAPLQPSVVSTALCLLYSPFPLYGPLFLLRPSVLATALCPPYGPLSPLRPSVPTMVPWLLPRAHCSLYGSLSPLRPSVTSTPPVPSTALWPLATALCPLYGPLSPLCCLSSKTTPLVSRNVLRNAFCQNP